MVMVTVIQKDQTETAMDIQRGDQTVTAMAMAMATVMATAMATAMATVMGILVTVMAMVILATVTVTHQTEMVTEMVDTITKYRPSNNLINWKLFIFTVSVIKLWKRSEESQERNYYLFYSYI